MPISQGEELYTGLRLLGKETELVRYPGGFHIRRTPSQAVDYDERILALEPPARRPPGRQKAGAPAALDSIAP